MLLREGLVSMLPASHGAQGQRGSLAAVIVVFTALATSCCCWHCGLESLARHLLGFGPPLCGMSWSAAKPEQWLFLIRSKGFLICFSKLEKEWWLLIDDSKTFFKMLKINVFAILAVLCIHIYTFKNRTGGKNQNYTLTVVCVCV